MIQMDAERVYAEINLDALESNVKNMKKNMKPGTGLIGVVKADAYGHGAVPIALQMEAMEEVSGFAVATAGEALELRENGVQKPILILGYVSPYFYEQLIRADVRMAAFREDTVSQLSDAVKRLSKQGIQKKAIVHVKVDTGMSRIGIRPGDAGIAFVKKLLACPEIEVEGVLTHFARADENDKTSAKEQYRKFTEFVSTVESETGHHFKIKHCDNSAGIIELPEDGLDAGRAGIILYGLWPSQDVKRNIVDLRPVLSLYSRVVYVKEIAQGDAVSYGATYTAKEPRRVATVSVGYGDGYARSLSNKGEVLIRGKRAKILGRVCMDMIIVDVTQLPDVTEGDLVTLIGRDGDEMISMEELGELSGRFNYEFACDLSKRVPRVYIKDGVMVR